MRTDPGTCVIAVAVLLFAGAMLIAGDKTLPHRGNFTPALLTLTLTERR